MSLFAVSLFNVIDAPIYASYVDATMPGIARHGGLVVMGGRQVAQRAELAVRQAMVISQWPAMANFEAYRDDPALAQAHALRLASTSDFLLFLYEQIDVREIAQLINK